MGGGGFIKIFFNLMSDVSYVYIFFFKLVVIFVFKVINVYFLCYIYFCMLYICRKRVLRILILGLFWWWNLENMFLDIGKFWKYFDRVRLKWLLLLIIFFFLGIVIWKFWELIYFWYIFYLIFGFGVEKMKMKLIGFKVYFFMRMGIEFFFD